jgi:hypothetical protein
LADEYDDAQERGDAAKAGDNQHNRQVVPSGNDLGLTRKDIHGARLIRNAEEANPGVVRRTLNAERRSNREISRLRAPKVGNIPLANSTRCFILLWRRCAHARAERRTPG